MHDLGSTDGSKIAITLVGKDVHIRTGSLDTGGYCWGASMRSLSHIKIEEFVSKNGATYRGYTGPVDLRAQCQLMDSAISLCATPWRHPGT
jgi:hypothetical protein